MLHSPNKVFFLTENQKASTATASMTCGPSGPAAHFSVLLKLRVDMLSLFMRICSVQTEMDSQAKSFKRILIFKSVFFLLLHHHEKDLVHLWKEWGTEIWQI